MSLRRFCTFLFLASIFPSALYGQISEDFSDGDFTSNPAWSGSESLFVVENEVLRSNSPGEANYFLSTPNTEIDDTEWTFYINLDFSTSGANYVDVYLVADNADLSAVQNGYFLRFGGTPDEISFYKISSGDQSLLIDGEDGVIGSSGNNIFELKVQRTASGDWTVAYDPDQSGTFLPGGSVNDNDISTTAFFGFRIEQSSAASPVNSHYFDAISVGPIPVDTTPPEVISATAPSDTQLQLTFSEPVEQSSAENIENYDITGVFSSVSAAELDAQDPSVVNLTLDLPVGNGATIVLFVMNIEDLSGNAMDQQTLEILYFSPDDAGYKDVVFNEIMADPSPSQGLPDAEFIEIFNASETKIFDFQNWEFANSDIEKVLGAAVLMPGEYLLLCDVEDTSLLAPFGNTLGIASFTAIANSGDSLTLLNPDGELIDRVSFTTDWYNDPDKDDGGYTLELINPFTDCSGQSNWSASNSSNGGTPGDANSIFDDSPDTTPPTISSFLVLSDQSLRIHFNETMDESSLNNATYSWSGGISTSGVNPAADLTSVMLDLDSPLQTGLAYTLTISGVADCPGNEIAPNTSIEILLGVQPELYDLLITEIMADPSPSQGLPEGEYFELYNASDKVIDIAGVSLNDKTLTDSEILFPGDYLLCIDAANATAFLLYPDAYILPDLGSTYFTNGGRDVRLYNASGDFIDQANYSSDWYGDPEKTDGGYSLERINLEEPCRSAGNWKASEASQGGTPGQENSVNSTIPDTQMPHLTEVFVEQNNSITVHFSEPIDSLSLLTAEIEISPEINPVSIDNVPPYYTSIQVELNDTLTGGVIYTLSITGIKDCVGNEMTETESLPFGLPQEGLPGDILINEILFNPNTGGSDFVEIVNVSDKIVGLQEWTLQNQSLTTDIITDEPLVIFPGDYMVFTESPQNIEQEYPFGKPENYVEVESVPSYSNSEGAVILTNAMQEVIDRFDYTEDYHFSLLTSFKGVSLERTSFTRPTQDPGNWTSAAETEGFATPGKINSQYNPEGTATSNFELESKLFSPDNDGFEDILNINYTFDSPGNAATLKIFDRRGRQVKLLTDNELLGTEGTLTWDGVTDRGSKARIGPYILLISVFDLDGNTETVKLPLIVAGNLSN